MTLDKFCETKELNANEKLEFKDFILSGELIREEEFDDDLAHDLEDYESEYEEFLSNDREE